MVYTETTYTGYFGRIGNAIKGMIFGPILLILAVILLFWNEGRAVHTARTLAEGKSSVVHVDPAKVDSANEGKLVHFTARAINATGDKLVDPTFHVSQDAIHLRRDVLMYQWKENKDTGAHNNAVGGGQTQTTTYSYSKVWEKSPIDSGSFKEQGHDNPAHWRLDSQTEHAPTVTAGAFTLDGQLAGMIDNFTPVDLSADTVDGLASDLKSDAVLSNNAVFFANEPGQKADPGSAKIGDLKVSFQAALPGDVSVIARQTGSTLSPYQTANNPLELLYVGTHSSDEMFKSEQHKNAMLAWILRAVGFVLMWIGLALIFSPLAVLASVINIIGDIVGAGIGIVTFVLAIAGSFITIAVAWITYRPIVGIALLAVAVGAIVWFFMLRSRGSAQRKAGGNVQGAHPATP